MSIADLVAHVRVWTTTDTPKRYYGRYLDLVRGWSDDQIAEVVRFVKTTRGAEMAVAHVVKTHMGAHK